MRSRSQVKAGLSRKWRTTKWVERGVVGRGTMALVFFYEWRGTLWLGEGVATERGMRGRWRGWERASKGGRAAALREK
jgi:hypothetical protein